MYSRTICNWSECYMLCLIIYRLVNSWAWFLNVSFPLFSYHRVLNYSNCSKDFIVPTFEENWIVMLDVVFRQNFLYTIKDISFLSSYFKRHFNLSFGVWKLPKLPCSGLNYARFEEFIHNAESVTQIISAWRIIPHDKIVPNWIEAR